MQRPAMNEKKKYETIPNPIIIIKTIGFDIFDLVDLYIAKLG